MVALTCGQTFNSGGGFTTLDLFDPNDSSAGITSTDGRLFATSFLTPGVVAGIGTDAEFVAGALVFLLAQVDFDVVGLGTANFDLILGDLGGFNDGVGPVVPSFGSIGRVDR